MKLPNIWVHVLPGKPNDEVSPKRLQVSDVPIQYQQGEKPLCFGKSLASALYYIDLKEAAGNINSIASHFSNLALDEACKDLQKYMKEHVPIVGIGQPYNDNKWRSKSGHRKKNVKKITIEDLLKIKIIYPNLVIPSGNDGSTGHAVCVVDDLIFDSTQENVLKLCRESLDWICGKKGCKDIYMLQSDFNNQLREILAI